MFAMPFCFVVWFKLLLFGVRVLDVFVICFAVCWLGVWVFYSGLFLDFSFIDGCLWFVVVVIAWLVGFC